MQEKQWSQMKHWKQKRKSKASLFSSLPTRSLIYSNFQELSIMVDFVVWLSRRIYTIKLGSFAFQGMLPSRRSCKILIFFEEDV